MQIKIENTNHVFTMHIFRTSIPKTIKHLLNDKNINLKNA